MALLVLAGWLAGWTHVAWSSTSFSSLCGPLPVGPNRRLVLQTHRQPSHSVTIHSVTCSGTHSLTLLLTHSLGPSLPTSLVS